MLRALCLLTLISTASFAQVRVDKLVINKGEVYELSPSDIIVADTLVMMDSSRIVLNHLKTENYVRASVAYFGAHCMIDGRGVSGKKGGNGLPGTTPMGPCLDGRAGRNGLRGLDGASGIDLFLYVDTVTEIGKLIIDLSGGNGGDGGNGGLGGGGSPGTTHCNGGDGGNGGNGGAGGNGGEGGTLTLGGDDVDAVRGMLGAKVIVLNKGGSFGYGGISGHGGPAGLGPSKRHGKPGTNGSDGSDGQAANNGTVLFEEK